MIARPAHIEAEVRAGDVRTRHCTRRRFTGAQKQANDATPTHAAWQKRGQCAREIARAMLGMDTLDQVEIDGS